MRIEGLVQKNKQAAFDLMTCYQGESYVRDDDDGSKYAVQY